MSSKTATKIDTGNLYAGWTGDAALYRLDPPMDADEPAEFVVVSAADVMFSGPETYIFAADASGEVRYWVELDGSTKGILDHAAALAAAGYSVVQP